MRNALRPTRPGRIGKEPGRRLLLVTSSLGCGHARASTAVAAAVATVDAEAVVEQLDFWSLMNPAVAATIRQKYLELVLQHSSLYARLHRLDERTWRRVIENDIPPPAEVIDLIELLSRTDDAERRPMASFVEQALGPYPTDLLLYPTARAALPTTPGELAGANVALLRLALLKWAFLRLQGRMEQRLVDFQPDVVIATQMVPAALVSALKRTSSRWSGLPLVGVLTDFGAHDYWAQPGIDRYCVPHDSLAGPPLAVDAAEAARRIVVTGVPLMSGFAAPPSRQAARRTLGLEPDDGRAVVLVLGGGLGLGLEDVVAPLLPELRDARLIVMAGGNEAARQRLQALAGTIDPRSRTTLHVYGWTDEMATFLAASDLVVGKSGGLTVAEVLACGRPLLVARTLQGQESFNVQFLERHGLGGFTSHADLPARVRDWLADRPRLEAVQERAAMLGRRDGARRVAEVALELAARPDAEPRVVLGSGA